MVADTVCVLDWDDDLLGDDVADGVLELVVVSVAFVEYVDDFEDVVLAVCDADVVDDADTVVVFEGADEGLAYILGVAVWSGVDVIV